MQIQTARPEDADAISALICGVASRFTLDPAGNGAEQFFDTLTPVAIRGYIAAANFSYALGWSDGVLAGVLAVRDNRHLFHLFVAPQFQRRGIAKALWIHARALAEQTGNPGRFTVNSSVAAVPVYKRLGFVVCGTEVHAHGIAFVPMQLLSA